MKSAAEIRKSFLAFFAEQGHHIVPSAPVVPHGDPTLLFTNAGMNQFKDVFLGARTPEHPRVADTQKCIRVSGKHNDLEEVGVDTYHHTFFEMLGNWSFGDYFKAEAIRWAWQFLTDHCALPKDKLWVTVFGGDQQLGLPPDTEAEALWPRETGIPAERVLRFGKKDNFWEMAATGPCGPCSEIHMDRGPGACDRQHESGHVCGVNAGCARYIEIWNLVFIQFNHRPDGSLEQLPAKHVDTGMGFERLTAVMQGCASNYDTDLFRPLLAASERLSGVRYTAGPGPTDVAHRVVADHIRTLCVAIADGALPNNTGRGYVLRRLLRRAVRFGRQVLGLHEPFMHALVPVVAEIFAEVFPEIPAQQEHISLVLRAEEAAFARTIDRGIRQFTEVADALVARGETTLPGAQAFDLFSTDGFPRDLIDLMARERGLVVDEAGWQRARDEHERVSGGRSTEPAFDLKELEGLPATTFVGYWERGQADALGTTTAARLVKLIGTEALVLDRTPFYAESGGQLGDAGVVEAPGFRFVVHDTGRIGDVWVHYGSLEQGDLGALPGEVHAQVDLARRRRIMANHTATHLLHWALKQVLGAHANQQGSLVGPDYLRFDFTHPRAIGAADLATIERLVNERIVGNTAVAMREERLDDAKAQGVTALFGEKYGERVRVVQIGDFSAELCGGTHATATGDIGLLRIVREEAVAAGVRRIVAETGPAAVAAFQADREALALAAARLGVPARDLGARIEKLQEQIRQLKAQGSADGQHLVAERRRSLLGEAPVQGGVRVVVAAERELDRKQLATLADELRGLAEPVAGLLAGVQDDAVVLLAFCSRELADAGRVHAGQLLASVAPVLGGRGGGRPDFAQGGGKDPARLGEALDGARRWLAERLAR